MPTSLLASAGRLLIAEGMMRYCQLRGCLKSCINREVLLETILTATMLSSYTLHSLVLC
jgi:hypothetical protein